MSSVRLKTPTKQKLTVYKSQLVASSIGAMACHLRFRELKTPLAACRTGFAMDFALAFALALAFDLAFAFAFAFPLASFATIIKFQSALTFFSMAFATSSKSRPRHPGPSQRQMIYSASVTHALAQCNRHHHLRRSQ